MSSNKRNRGHQQPQQPQPQQERVDAREHEQPAAPERPPNLAAGVELPTMRPSRDTGSHETVDAPQDPRAQDPRARAPARRRMAGRRPMKGIGEPQGLEHRSLVNQANQLFELYKKDPTQVDPAYIQLMQLQGMVSYGAQVREMNELGQQLKGEIASLRDLVHSYIEGDGPAPRDDAAKRRSGLAARLAAKRARQNGVRGRGRGRARTRVRGRA